MKTWLAVSFVIISSFGFNHDAHANSREDMFGAGGRGIAMGGAGTAIIRDSSAVYYNLANIAFADSNSFTFGYSHVNYTLKVETDEPDAPATEDLRSRHTVSMGIINKLPYDLTVGAWFNLGLKTTQFFDQYSPRPTPRFGLYGQQQEQMSIMVGLAYKVLDNLSIGAGTSALVNSTLVLENKIPYAVPDEEVENGYSWNLDPAPTLYAGINYQPAAELSLGLSYRSEMFHKLDAFADVLVNFGGAEIPMEIMFESYAWYSPQQVALGFGYSPVSVVTIAADVTWYQWSEYPGPYVHPSAQEDSKIAEGLNYPAPVVMDFKDVVVPRVGLELTWLGQYAARLGYRFHVSPAPLPTDRTNYLDADTHFFSGGAGYTWTQSDEAPSTADPKDRPARTSVSFDVYGIAGVMTEQSVNKSEEQDVLNKYRFGGVVYEGGLMVTARF